MPDREVLTAALDYLSMGLKVIALTGKAPNGKVHHHGLHEPFGRDNLDGVMEAFLHPATTGVGILTTWPLIVIDIDSEQGAQNWRDLMGDAFIPDRWVARTGRSTGGLHIYYLTGEEPRTFKPFGNEGGVDIKAEGGYVAAPPSIHPDSGLRYSWLLPPDGALPPPAPEPVVRLLRERAFDLERKVATKQATRRVRHLPLEGGKLWASFGFEHLYDAMRNEPPGNRNNFLHWAAATMAEEGATDEEFDLLLAAAPDLGMAGRRTVRSARRHVAGG